MKEGKEVVDNVSLSEEEVRSVDACFEDVLVCVVFFLFFVFFFFFVMSCCPGRSFRCGIFR